MSMPYSQFFSAPGAVSVEDTSDSGDVIVSTTTAADTRNVGELQRRIDAANGALTVSPNSSDYIVAINNRLRFLVTRQNDGQFVIRKSETYVYLIGAAIVVGLILLTRG